MLFYIQVHGLLQILWIQFFPNIKLFSIPFLKTFLHQRTIFYLIIISLISSFYKELIFGPTPYIFFYLSSEISGLEIIPVFYFFLLFFTLSSSLFPLTHSTHSNHYTWTAARRHLWPVSSFSTCSLPLLGPVCSALQPMMAQPSSSSAQREAATVFFPNESQRNRPQIPCQILTKLRLEIQSDTAMR
jgi:hypothetical protein